MGDGREGEGDQIAVTELGAGLDVEPAESASLGGSGQYVCPATISMLLAKHEVRRVSVEALSTVQL